MADELKSQINVTADVSGAVQGFNEVGQAAQRAADQVKQAGTQAEQGVEKVNQAVEAQSNALNRNEKTLAQQINRRIQDLQRENAQLVTNSKTSEEYFQVLSKQRSVDPARLDAYLNALKKENDLLTANVRVIEEQAAQQRLLNQARQQAEALNKSRESFIDQLRREAEAIGKTRTELLALKAAELGVTQQAAPFLAQLQATEKQFDATGRSVRATTALLRQVPQQFTDIVVSLASGQQPLTVFLQQGGQLKDMFGSAGEAAKALGGYVLGLINPFSVAAVAVGGLAVAYFKGAQEAEAFGRALVLTGNQIGTSVSGLALMSAEISKIGTTQGRAAEALVAFVNTAKVGADQLQEFTRIALEFERAGGGAAEEVAKKFAELANEPLKASLKLNESMGYLSFSIAEQIRLLEEQGNKTEAARVAQQAYADAIRNATPQLVANIGFISKAWNAVADATKNALDKLLNVGRTDVGYQLAQAQERLNTILSAYKPGEAIRGLDKREVDQLQAQIAGWQAIVQFEQTYASNRAETARQEDARIAARQQFFRDEAQYLDKKAQKEREIAKVQESLRQGAISSDEAATRIAQINEKYKERERTVRGVKTAIDELAKAEATYAGIIAKESGYQTDFIAKWTQLNALRQAGRIDQEQLLAAQRALIEQQPFYLDNLKQEADYTREQAKGQEERNKAYEKTMEAIDKDIAKINEKKVAVDLEIDGLGKTGEALAEVTRARYDHQIAQVESQIALYAELPLMTQYIEKLNEQRDALMKLRDAEATRDVRKAAIKEAQDAEREWKKTAEGIERSLTDALMRGFESGKGFARTLRDTVVNMFKTMVLRPIIQAVVSPVAQGAMSLLGLPTAAAAATGGASSALGTAGSLIGAGGIAGTLGLFGSGFSSGLSAWAAGGSVTGLLGSGSLFAGGIANGLGLVAGALAPVAVGLALVASLLKGGGETRSGSSYAYSRTGGDINVLQGTFNVPAGTVTANLRGPSGGPIGGSQGDIAAQQAVTATITGVNALFDKLGAESRIDQFWTKLESSTNDRGGVLTGGRLTTGAAFGETGFGSNYDGTLFESGTPFTLNGEEAVRAFSLDLQQSIIQALRAASDELPSVVSDLLANIDAEALTQEQVSAVLQSIDALSALLDVAAQLSIPLEAVTTAMVEAAGGAQALTAGFGAYVQNFYTDAEKFNLGMAQLGESFAAIGIDTVPQTREAFRELVEGLDLTTESGQAQYGALISLAGAFAALVPPTEKIATAVDETTGAIQTSVSEMLRRLQQDTADLERELAILQGTDVRTLDIAVMTEAEIAVYDYNVSLREQIAALQEAQAASERAAQAEEDRVAAIAAQSKSLQDELFRLTATAEEIKTAERAQIDESNLAIYDRIVALKDERIAAEEATRAADELARQQQQAADELARQQQQVAGERYGLETRLLQLQGDTAALRARELEALDPSNRALLERIFALQDEQSAAEELARQQQQAADEAARAAKEIADAWKSITDTLLEQATRIRGDITPTAGSYGRLQAEFALATAAARSGDQTAAGSLSSIADRLIAAGEAEAVSLLDVQRLRARIAASLEETANIVDPSGPTSVINDAATAGVQSRMAAEVETLRSDQRAQTASMNNLLLRFTRVLERWDGDGLPSTRVEA